MQPSKKRGILIQIFERQQRLHNTAEDIAARPSAISGDFLGRSQVDSEKQKQKNKR